MGGCGGNCACARVASDVKEVDCPMPEGGVHLDKDGKCPCGKGADNCCHKDTLGGGAKATNEANPAIGELCQPHGKQHLCEG